ncbi:MAG: zinc ribbon domain-containing protein [Clostridia bacterium]|nr:zinc ribbon domain-containing protein [Clostridia bacterium]
MENFLDSVKQAMDSAVKKTGQMVEKTKVKLAAVDTKNTLRATYVRLGELTYCAARGDETLGDQIEQVLLEIDRLKETLARQEESANETAGIPGTSGTKYCPHCGASCTPTALFCSNCGKQM